MIDLEKLIPTFRDHGRSFLFSLGCFIPPRPRRLQDRIIGLAARDQVMLMVLTLGAIALVITLSKWLIEDISPATFEGQKVTIQIALILGVTTIPYLLAYVFLQRSSVGYAASCLLMIALFQTIVAQIPGIVASNVQPMRYEFTAFSQGTGQGTAIYEHICGGLERTAHLAALNHEQTDLSAEVERLQADIYSARDPETLAQLRSQWEVKTRDFVQSLKMTLRVTAADGVAVAAAEARYRPFFAAQWVMAICAGCIGILAIFFLVKGLFLRVQSSVAKLITTVVSILAAVASIGLSYGFSQLAAYGDPDAYIPDTMPAIESVADVRRWEAVMARWKSERPSREARIRAEFLAQQKTCPGLNNSGLW